MRNAHLLYLKKAVKIAIKAKGIADIGEEIGRLKSCSMPIYRIIREICSDFRFYSVTSDTPFWNLYASYSLYFFLESLPPEDLDDSGRMQKRKLDFLNNWFLRHSVTMSHAREKDIRQELEAKGWCKPHSVNTDPEFRRAINFGKNSDEDDLADAFIVDLPSEIKNFHSVVTKQSEERLKIEPHRAEAVYLASIDPELRKLAMMIGRSGGYSSSRQSGLFQHSRRSDISGIATGNDLGSLLPSELALLGQTSTENLFYRKYAQKRLQIFSSSSTSPSENHEKKGAVFMCIDTSGSMSGNPERMAKSLALAIAIIAQREKRPVCLVNYSDRLSFLILLNLRKQHNQLMKFLANSYSGGNNESMLFDFLFRLLPDNPEYRQFSKRFVNADLLVISDFQWAPLHDNVKDLIAEVRVKGMKFHALGVNMEESMKQLPCDDDEYITTGIDFFRQCDYRFTYMNGIRKC